MSNFPRKVDFFLTTLSLPPRLIKKFDRTGSVADDNLSRTGRPRSKRNDENIAKAGRILKDDPNISMEKLAQMLDLSPTTAWRIVREDLDLFPYKIQTAQPISETAAEKRLAFANRLIQDFDRQIIDPKMIWFSDEAHFWLEGYVNSQNSRFWGTSKPEFVIVKPLHPKRITVWCAISGTKLIGPYFIETSVNSQVYCEQILTPFLNEAQSEKLTHEHWFQQDGAPPHRTENAFQLLYPVFSSRVIALGYPGKMNCGIEWPPYSPDLNPCDFFLWGYLKDRIYKNAPKTIDQLKSAITREIQTITTDLLERVSDGFEHRLRHLVRSQGRHFEHMIN